MFTPGTRVQMDGLKGTVVEREPRAGHTPVLWDLYQKVTFAPTHRLEKE